MERHYAHALEYEIMATAGHHPSSKNNLLYDRWSPSSLRIALAEEDCKTPFGDIIEALRDQLEQMRQVCLTRCYANTKGPTARVAERAASASAAASAAACAPAARPSSAIAAVAIPTSSYQFLPLLKFSREQAKEFEVLVCEMGFVEFLVACDEALLQFYAVHQDELHPALQATFEQHFQFPAEVWEGCRVAYLAELKKDREQAYEEVPDLFRKRGDVLIADSMQVLVNDQKAMHQTVGHIMQKMDATRVLVLASEPNEPVRRTNRFLRELKRVCPP